jgi:hypothetical protein
MRYYAYNEYEPNSLWADEEDNLVVILSEEDILKNYWPWWYGKMCKRFGKEEVDKYWTFEDCLEDWIVVNWAWKVEKKVENND